MTKETYDFAECVAALALDFTKREEDIADKADGKTQDRLEVGKAIGQIDAYNQASKEILSLLDDFDIHSEYIDIVKSYFERVEIDIIFPDDQRGGQNDGAET